MGKRKTKGKPNPKAKPGYARADHLRTCALHIAKLGNSKNDGFSKISRRISKLCRQVMDSDMVQMEPEKKQVFCKKCREVLVGKIAKTEISSKIKNTITEKCGNCGNSRNYMTLKGYGLELKNRQEKNEIKS
ncbi:unnamed protein product [Caenorhabditis angaria]|uniref:Uncharacterized protein n=1 Tax=Caenorhabditis angaria TaxID=860376 RepID=A0A9P1N3Z9_9PELO|nr:unnamed protein product [Caenorhabditis angaria]